MTTDMEMIRFLVNEWVARHHAECTHRNCIEPANFVAWVAHGAGLHSRDVSTFADRLQVYEANCPNCQHGNGQRARTHR